MNINCSCIRGNYNFDVKSLDKNNLIYRDMSDWMDEAQYSDPDTYTVVVIPPGESSGYSLDLDVTGTNQITADQVGGSIKDGVWCFQTDSCGVNYKRSIGIFYAIECCIRKAYATEPIRRHEAIQEVEHFIALSKAAISINNINEATDYLEIAEDKLDRIKCDCNC